MCNTRLCLGLEDWRLCVLCLAIWQWDSVFYIYFYGLLTKQKRKSKPALFWDFVQNPKRAQLSHHCGSLKSHKKHILCGHHACLSPFPKQGGHKFSKNPGAYVPQWGPINIGCHHTKFCHPSTKLMDIFLKLNIVNFHRKLLAIWYITIPSYGNVPQ